MLLAVHILLLSLGWLTRLDILVWVVGIPLLLGFVLLLLYQRRQHRELMGEVEQLSKVKRHNIEYDLVLKAMKLSTWRIDVPTQVFSFESDYRDHADNVVFPADATVDDVFKAAVEPHRSRARRNMDDLLAGRTDNFHEQYQMRIPHTDKTYWAETFATIDKRDLEGRPLTIVGTTMRIDRQKQAEQDLIEARNHAEESDRLKSAFLANMSHEIRTPLNAIVGFSDVLPMVQTDEERQQLIDLIKQNNTHLLRLFDDMVNMSKLEAGGTDVLHKTSFDLTSLLNEMAQKHAVPAMQKGLTIHVRAGREGLMLNTDRDRLNEILNQYMNNAVKFTSSGSVTLGFDQRDDLVRVWVDDTGKGIPADKCNEHLFERFVKVDEFIPGTGLGLSICRSQAAKLGGRVGVESTLGKGSRFWVDLPQG